MAGVWFPAEPDVVEAFRVPSGPMVSETSGLAGSPPLNRSIGAGASEFRKRAATGQECNSTAPEPVHVPKRQRLRIDSPETPLSLSSFASSSYSSPVSPSDSFTTSSWSFASSTSADPSSSFDLDDFHSHIDPLIYNEGAENPTSVTAAFETSFAEYRADLGKEEMLKQLDPRLQAILPEDPNQLEGIIEEMRQEIRSSQLASGGAKPIDVMRARHEERSLLFYEADAEALLANTQLEEFLLQSQRNPHLTDPSDPRYSSVFKEVFPGNKADKTSASSSSAHDGTELPTASESTPVAGNSSRAFSTNHSPHHSSNLNVPEEPRAPYRAAHDGISDDAEPSAVDEGEVDADEDGVDADNDDDGSTVKPETAQDGNDYGTFFICCYELPDAEEALNIFIDVAIKHPRHLRRVIRTSLTLNRLVSQRCVEPIFITHVRCTGRDTVPSDFFRVPKSARDPSLATCVGRRSPTDPRVFQIVPANVLFTDSRDPKGQRLHANTLTQETFQFHLRASQLILGSKAPLNVASGGLFNGRYARSKTIDEAHSNSRVGLSYPPPRSLAAVDPPEVLKRMAGVADVIRALYSIYSMDGVQEIVGKLPPRPSQAVLDRIIADAQNFERLEGWDGVLQFTFHKDDTWRGLEGREGWNLKGSQTAQTNIRARNRASGQGDSTPVGAHGDYYSFFDVRWIRKHHPDLFAFLDVLCGIGAQALLCQLEPTTINLHGDLVSSAAEQQFFTHTHPDVLAFCGSPNATTFKKVVDYARKNPQKINVRSNRARIGRCQVYELMPNKYAALGLEKMHEGTVGHESELWAASGAIIEMCAIVGSMGESMTFEQYRSDAVLRKTAAQLMVHAERVLERRKELGLDQLLATLVNELKQDRLQASSDCTEYRSNAAKLGHVNRKERVDQLDEVHKAELRQSRSNAGKQAAQTRKERQQKEGKQKEVKQKEVKQKEVKQKESPLQFLSYTVSTGGYSWSPL